MSDDSLSDVSSVQNSTSNDDFSQHASSEEIENELEMYVGQNNKRSHYDDSSDSEQDEAPSPAEVRPKKRRKKSHNRGEHINLEFGSRQEPVENNEEKVNYYVDEEKNDVSDMSEEEEEETNETVRKNNDIYVLSQYDAGNNDNIAYELMHGTDEEHKQLEQQMSSFTKSDWCDLAESLLRINLDTSCSDRDLMMTFKIFQQLFCYPYQNDYDVIDRMNAIYPNITNMKDQYKKIQQLFGLIEYELMNRNLVNEENREGRETKRMLTQVAFGMKITFEQMVLNRILQKGNDNNMRAMLEEMTPLAIFQEIDTVKLKKHQQLLHFYYREAFKSNLKKDGECLYKPKYNKFGQFVYAYEYACDISDFVYSTIYPLEQNHYWFDCLTENGGNAKKCIDWLTNIKCEWLPDLERNRSVHAFQNGIFVLTLNEFFYLEQKEGKRWVGELGGNLIAIKYHDIIFNEEAMYEEMHKFEIPTYMAIELTDVHMILSTQNFDMEERRWIFGLLGRTLFTLGEMDAWGIFPYFLGLAGTGKSSLLRLTASLLEARDVGYFNNTMQRTFPLEDIYDKLVYFALDIDKHFNLDQATFQSMVVGEEVPVLRKFKKPITVLWKIHGGFAGNTLPPWQDNGGSLARRLIVIEFTQVVRRVDPNLFERCIQNRDRYLKVIVSAYHELCREHNTRSVKEVMPQKFRDSERKALKELNTLQSFVDEYCEIDPATDRDKITYIDSWSDFQKCWKAYCKKSSIRAQTLSYTFYNGVFAKRQITVVSTVKANDEFGQTQAYIKGLRLKPSGRELIAE